MEESPSHMLDDCAAYNDLRVGLCPLLSQSDRAVFLRRAVTHRKALKQKLEL